MKYLFSAVALNFMGYKPGFTMNFLIACLLTATSSFLT